MHMCMLLYPRFWFSVSAQPTSGAYMEASVVICSCRSASLFCVVVCESHACDFACACQRACVGGCMRFCMCVSTCMCGRLCASAHNVHDVLNLCCSEKEGCLGADNVCNLIRFRLCCTAAGCATDNDADGRRADSSQVSSFPSAHSSAHCAFGRLGEVMADGLDSAFASAAGSSR
jgi:hypothetical protein